MSLHYPAEVPVKNDQAWTAGAAKRADKVLVEYLERRSVVVPGPVTGRAYAFSRSESVQAVLAADAEELERTGFFRRVGSA
jgi:hypothetical protein